MSSSHEAVLNRLASGGPRARNNNNSKKKMSIKNILLKLVSPYKKQLAVVSLICFFFLRYVLLLAAILLSLVLLASLLLFYTPLGDYLHHATARSNRVLPGASREAYYGKHHKETVFEKDVAVSQRSSRRNDQKGATGGEEEVGYQKKKMVGSKQHYNQFHGHPAEDLRLIHDHLKNEEGVEEFIWFAGDSSLDNKHWIAEDRAAAVNGFENILMPATSVKDVCYWLNKLLEERYTRNRREATTTAGDEGDDGRNGPIKKTACMMTSVEATTVSDRRNRLLFQDKVIQERLSEVDSTDTIIVSVGGNDVALQPSVMTGLAMVGVMYSPRWLLKTGFAPGLRHVKKVLFDQVNQYLIDILKKSSSSSKVIKIPKQIIVCQIYYPDQQASGSWADATLELLGYNEDPSKLQFVINEFFEQLPQDYDLLSFTPQRGRRGGGQDNGSGKKRSAKIPVKRIALHRHGLDGTDSNDYIARVEPSVQGGKKMAQAFMEYLYPTPKK